MKNWLLNIFSMNTAPDAGKSARPYMTGYKGLSDFLHNASEEKKIEVFTEAARRANEDQRKTLERASLTLSH